jgi:tetratricopeptide (TPR) repeat protein
MKDRVCGMVPPRGREPNRCVRIAKFDALPAFFCHKRGMMMENILSRRGMLSTLAIFFGLSAQAMAANVVERAGDKLRYENCLSLAGLNPSAALGVANKWVDEKGGPPAEHCAAVALVGLKHYAEAGAKLDALGHAPDVGDLRASLFDQAGNAWLLAGDAPHATASFQAALALSGNDPDLYADLARAQALSKDWRSVEADMNAALAVSPRRYDLLVLRASARHALRNLSGARSDVLAALMLKPNYAEALVERGSLARESGDVAAARSDFEAALNAGAVGQTGEAARRSLAALDEDAKPKSASTPKPATPAKPKKP